jgi:hypothetical protein
MKEIYRFYSAALWCLYLTTGCSMAGFGQMQTARFIATSANSNGFYEYLPEGYGSGSASYPLMVFLHGAGELGNGGSDLPLVLKNGPPKLINAGTFPNSFTVNGSTFSFIVLSPQFINVPSDDDVDAIINYAKLHYRVDINRIYLTGLSMGGGITWDYAAYGGSGTGAAMLAAILPVSGAEELDAPAAQHIASAKLPVYATHNQDDPTVPSSYTVTNVDLINSSNPPPNPMAIDTIFPVSGHDAWTKTYDPAFVNPRIGLNVYQWMLQFTRGSIILPVTLTDYSALLSDDRSSVTVSWTTAKEENNRYFVLQRSADGQSFSDIDTVAATNQSDARSYYYIDKAPLRDHDFYRLSQIDLDGKTTLFSVLEVTISGAEAGAFLVSPNPAHNTIFLQLAHPEQGPLSVRLSDGQGKIVRTWRFNKQGTLWKQAMDVSNLPAGNYFVTVEGGKTIREVRQFVKE